MASRRFSLRDLANAVGMRAPSLYSYFDSKHAIYDAMFAQGNRELLEVIQAQPPSTDLREVMRQRARMMFEFNKKDPARYQLMFTRMLPGFEPSPESYAVAVQVLGTMQRHFADAGLDDPRALDMWTALVSGLFNQQAANDPGGERWERLIDDAVDMFLDYFGYERKGKRR